MRHRCRHRRELRVRRTGAARRRCACRPELPAAQCHRRRRDRGAGLFPPGELRDRSPLSHWPVRPPAPRREPRRRGAHRQLRRAEGEPPCARLQGESPLLYRRYRGRPAGQRGRRHDHLQLRWRREAPHDHRGRLLHRLGYHAGRAGARRPRLLYRRRLDHQQRYAGRPTHPGALAPGLHRGLDAAQEEELAMCGIVGAAARRNIVPVLVDGLKRLEYRGYDSAGIAVVNNATIKRVRAAGRVAELATQTTKEHVDGATGIAHTRWATHGAPTERNAHPHVSGDIALVHNGIVENHEAIRERLKRGGYTFVSETDTEVVAHLVAEHRKSTPSLFAAAVRAISELEGAFALAIVCARDPEAVVVARRGPPLLLGVGEGETFAASDVSALLQVTRRVVYLEDGDCAEIRPGGYRVVNARGEAVERAVHLSEVTDEAVALGPYRHYMQKEIHEQPGALANTLEVVSGASSLQPGLFGADGESLLRAASTVHLVACGTSYHAALIARYWLEDIAGIPTLAEIASEYRYRRSVPDPNGLFVTISQSGETADTLAAVEHAKALGYRATLSICNVPESSLIRASRLRFLTRAGPEIGVASTKAFTTQLGALFLLALVIGKVRGRLAADAERAHLQSLRHLPAAVNEVLAVEPRVAEWAARFAVKEHALFLGRGIHWPIAMEGALKLKEISYIHAEAYAAGELKHGPLALVDRRMPVIAIAPKDALLDKLKSNLQEVRARGGELYVLANCDASVAEEEGVHVIRMSDFPGLLSPIVSTVPLQLLAYHAALHRGNDVDKPRNLAKSVTVE